MRGLLADTYREMLNRKFLYIIGFMTLITLVIVFISWKITESIGITTNGMPQVADSAAVFKSVDLYLTFAVMLVTLFTAGLIPTMFEKGRAEYYLSKPISRFQLLLTKITAIWIVYGSVMVLSSLLVICSIGLLHGTSLFGFAYIILINLLLWMIWLSITSFVGMTLSPATIISVFAIWVVQALLSNYESLIAIMQSEILKNLIKWAYYIFPKTSQIGEMGILLGMGKDVDSWLPLWSSLIFAVVMFALANWSLKRRDY